VGSDFKQLRFCSDSEGIRTFGTKIGIIHGLQNLLEIGMVVSHREHIIHWMPVMTQLWMPVMISYGSGTQQKTVS
jgi:hypothetical protein